MELLITGFILSVLLVITGIYVWIKIRSGWKIIFPLLLIAAGLTLLAICQGLHLMQIEDMNS